MLKGWESRRHFAGFVALLALAAVDAAAFVWLLGVTVDSWGAR